MNARDYIIDGDGCVLEASGSAINAVVYTQGLRGDYDAWMDSRCLSLASRSCSRNFMRSEHFNGPATAPHGMDGRLRLSPARNLQPLAPKFLQACAKEGLLTRIERCDGAHDGAYLALGTTRHGRRNSTRTGYLGPMRRRVGHG
jgi:hypothetical protein